MQAYSMLSSQHTARSGVQILHACCRVSPPDNKPGCGALITCDESESLRITLQRILAPKPIARVLYLV
jgi:hypothetical protein